MSYLTQIGRSQISDSQEENESKTDQDASILASMEFMTGKIATEGVFHYLPANKGEVEQTISFDTIVADCADKPDFVNAMHELYRTVKTPFIDKNYDPSKALIAFISELDKLVVDHVESCARDEHGLI